MNIQDLISILSSIEFSLNSEKILQSEIEVLFKNKGIEFEREKRLDKTNIPDFFIDGIAIEVKLKGSKRNIFRQCKRYCDFDQVNKLLLVTNKAMGLPEHINGKPCFILNLGVNWL